MEKQEIGKRPFGPFATVLVGDYVDGKADFATVGAWGVVSLASILFISKSGLFTLMETKTEVGSLFVSGKEH